MSFEVDRCSSAWAHIALCADLTWASEPPDEFVIANQRLWAQHCRVTRALHDASQEQLSLPSNNQCESTDKRPISSQSEENGSSNSKRCVKDVIPESRLAQFYGNFYYDEIRERCYTSPNDKTNTRGYNGNGCENPDLTECWMLPEVEYLFRKLLDEPSDRSLCPRRRRYYTPDEDFVTNGHRSAASERCEGRSPSADEAALAARLLSVRALWARPRAPSPPTSRKMRARRRQPRRLTAQCPPYTLDMPAQLLCDPSCKFQFDSPRSQQLTECQRAMGRLSASVQTGMRASNARCTPYRGTNITRYAPTTQRPSRCPDRRYGIWWPRDHPSPRLERFQLANIPSRSINNVPQLEAEREETKKEEPVKSEENDIKESKKETDDQISPQRESESPEIIQKEKVVVDNQIPSTSSAAAEARKKRLYSTVLSMTAPPPINLNQLRLTQKLMTPGILKLNPKIVLPAARMRHPNVDNKFEELEKEALEQYKASDESIDTKFRELEKQAVEQYSTSNSNTSCSSGNSAEKKASNTPLAPENETNKKCTHFHKEKLVDSVVIYSQNFPDQTVKSQTPSTANLKNSHAPPRGEKKDQTHRTGKGLRNFKGESQRAASDTDYEARESNFKSHKGAARWSLHAVPPKKRHLTFCVSDFSSDEEMEDASRAIKDASPCIKNHSAGKIKMSAHGGGDLHPIMRKT